MSDGPLDCDVLIIGGGLVGSSLALALQATPLRVVLVEARDPRVLEQPSFDDRVTALGSGSKRILEGLGLWSEVARAAEPIRFIHVSERGAFGAARIDCEEEGVEALGYTLANRVLGEALWRKLGEAPRLRCFAPASLMSFHMGAAEVLARIRSGAGDAEVRARLLVAADGNRSSVRASLGIAAREDRYLQSAIIVNCATELPHGGRAFERFTPRGPLAALPLSDRRVAVVWTMAREQARHMCDWSDEAFRDALQRVLGFRLGRIVQTGRRSIHELSRVRSESVWAGRAVLIGNAAVSLHPVAGQGFNLALRDVAALAELVSDEARAGSEADVGSERVLRRYAAWRQADQRQIAGFTHGLIRLFGRDTPGLGVGRGLGLALFDLLPGAKARLARRTMGLAGRLPRLARGLPL